MISPELQELKDFINQDELKAGNFHLDSMENIESLQQMQSRNAMLAGRSDAMNLVLSKIDEIAARQPAPFVSKGDWIEEQGTGLLGYRCRRCYTWRYRNDEKRCSCDHDVN